MSLNNSNNNRSLNNSNNITNCSFGSPSPIKSNPIIKKTMDFHLKSNFMRQNLMWGIVNSVLLAAVIYDISRKCPFATSKWYYLEYFIGAVLILSTFYNFLKYLYYICSIDTIEGSQEQGRLLNLNEQDSKFILSRSMIDNNIVKQNRDTNNTSMTNNQSNLSWHSLNDSNNVSILSMSWFRNASPPTTPKSQQHLSHPTFTANMMNLQNNHSPSTLFLGSARSDSKDINVDENKLDKYLKDCSDLEESLNKSFDTHSTMGGIGSTMNKFWNYYKIDDVPRMLKTAIYQLSPTASQQNKSTNEEGSFLNYKDIDGNSELLGKLTLAQLSKFVSNLRMWISATILKTLVKEIENVNESFKTRGFIDIQIGTVGLERLKKTAENQQLVASHVPMLPLIIPYLEMSSNQEYLVQRIKDLAKNGCIANYRWNSGGSYNKLSWDEHLPTDSAILFHLFCTYLDGQLTLAPPPGGRPFFDRYVICSEKSSKEILTEIKNNSNCAILCANSAKTQFNFISDCKIHPCVHDRNNLFNVIIQFLIFMKTRNEGVLERVSLGPGGINLLCVIDD